MAGARAAARAGLRRALRDGDKLGKEEGGGPLVVTARGTFVRGAGLAHRDEASPGG
jgi:hypothetical protein